MSTPILDALTQQPINVNKQAYLRIRPIPKATSGVQYVLVHGDMKTFGINHQMADGHVVSETLTVNKANAGEWISNLSQRTPIRIHRPVPTPNASSTSLTMSQQKSRATSGDSGVRMPFRSNDVGSTPTSAVSYNVGTSSDARQLMNSAGFPSFASGRPGGGSSSQLYLHPTEGSKGSVASRKPSIQVPMTGLQLGSSTNLPIRSEDHGRRDSGASTSVNHSSGPGTRAERFYAGTTASNRASQQSLTNLRSTTPNPAGPSEDRRQSRASGAFSTAAYQTSLPYNDGDPMIGDNAGAGRVRMRDVLRDSRVWQGTRKAFGRHK